ncbi:MAG: alpha/beta hydrolase [Clostridia bacterium]|nr:alpha/beta hydrolase [Clostridia bacterium]
MQQFKLESYDGFPVFVTLWDDVQSPRAVIQICHGMSEYGGRYDLLAKYLNSRGYICFADDHRAHGRTETPENRGRHKGNIFKKTLQDQIFFREWLKEKYHLPVFFLGHSYGSFLGQAFAQSGTDVRAIGLIGTAYCNPLFKLGAIALAPLKLIAGNWRPKLVNKSSDVFFTYKGDSGPSQWLTRDLEWRKGYLEDEYCRTDMSVNFSFHLLNETSKLYSKKAAAKLNPATAIAMFCGTGDPIGGMGKKAKKLNEFYMKNGVKTDLHLYKDGRHEVHGELNRQEVWRDIANFFDKFIIYAQTSIDDLIGNDK